MAKKPCNCKRKKKAIVSLDSFAPTYTFDEVIEVHELLISKMFFNGVELNLMFDLHNRIYPLNKQLNINCGDCFKLVSRNLKNTYEKGE